MGHFEPQVNSIFQLIASGKRVSEGNEKGTNHTGDDLSLLAETEGFEPSIQFPIYTLSRRAPSTTRTSLQFMRQQIYITQRRLNKLIALAVVTLATSATSIFFNSANFRAT